MPISQALEFCDADAFFVRDELLFVRIDEHITMKKADALSRQNGRILRDYVLSAEPYFLA